jgi:hypothetical protein
MAWVSPDVTSMTCAHYGKQLASVEEALQNSGRSSPGSVSEEGVFKTTDSTASVHTRGLRRTGLMR